IITRLPKAGEHLTTLDGVERKLDPFTILVADTAGALSIGGVMGGGESEVSAATKNVLLEAAAWNFINIRRTVQAQGLQSSQAGYRFSRGVHPAMAERGCKRAAELMRTLAGGVVAKGLLDVYPRKPKRASVDLNENDVERILGIRIPIKRIVKILESLEFECDLLTGTREPTVRALAPDHRLDIGAGVIGQADVIEEVARVYGYERIPETQIGDTTPPQRANLSLEREEWTRDVLANVGLQEVVTYRLTAPEREALLMPPGVTKDDRSYVTITNPIAADRYAMRHSVLASVMEVAASNLRFTDRVAMFEIGAAYIARPKPTPSSPLPLPDEPRRLAVALTGPREPLGWQAADRAPMDFYDLKGVVESLAEGLHLPGVNFEQGDHPSFRPGRTAQLIVAGRGAGWMGELHPLVAEAYLKLAGASGHNAPILAADFDLELMLASVPSRHITSGVLRFPPVVEDIALIVDEGMAASRVESLIRETGGAVLADVRLFDLFKGDQIGAGKKSLAYRLTYQVEDRTLTGTEAAALRQKIVRRAAEMLGAELRESSKQ
ncbi:MAG: phenylalanine--tRNA ligase subunit beta, partial [Chloroflexota bacterium]